MSLPARFCRKFTPSILHNPSLSTIFLRPFSSRADLAILLQSCISSKWSYTDLCKTHSQMIVSGHASDTFLNNMLLNGYSRLDRLREAQMLFNGLIEKNLISWSTLISMYSKYGCGMETLGLFLGFRRSSADYPNGYIVSSVLRACSELQDWSYALAVHCYVLKVGFYEDIYVGSALLNLYLKIGFTDSGKKLFDELPTKNSVTWTIMISGLLQNGENEASLALLRQKMGAGVHLDKFLASSILSVCSALCLFEGGRQIHGYALRNGIELDISLKNVLIDFYSKCCRVKIAKRLFDAIIDKNIVSWTTMIAGYMQNSHDFEALALFRQMCHLGWRSDAFACTSVLISCGRLMALRQGKEVHTYALKSNLLGDEYVSNGIIDMYAKCYCLVDAREIFDAMKTHKLVSYNIMIEGYASQGELGESADLFNMMRGCSMHPNSSTFVSILGVSASQGALLLCMLIHDIIVKSGFSQDLHSSSALINVYSKCSCVEEARIVFEEMEIRDLAVWNAMVCGYTRNVEGEKAIRLYQDLCHEGISPDASTFVSLVTLASSMLILYLGLQFHAQVIKTGVVYDFLVTSALADMYGKCGAIKESMEVFDMVRASDVVYWNSLIFRCAEHGHEKHAFMVFRQMQCSGIMPNRATFLGILSACNHAGLVEEGLLYFNSMRSDFHVEAGIEHCACIVGLLGKAGKLKEAKEFIEKMQIESSTVVWRTLLAACKRFGDVGLGKYAAEKAIMLEPEDSSPYILLSNIFASKNMWTDVQKLRKEMDFHGVVKESGCSWIEVGMKIHTFVSKDTSHPESKSIYFALDMLTELSKDVFLNACSVDKLCRSG